MPHGDALVGVARGDVEHDDGRLAVDVVTKGRHHDTYAFKTSKDAKRTRASRLTPELTDAGRPSPG